jgi:hypothetical protein
MSATYQQDSRPNEKAMAIDPTNQWMWRSNIQRLDFEQVRDTLLVVGGQLDVGELGGHPFRLTGESDAAKANQKRYAATDLGLSNVNPNRRTVYAMIDRAGLPEVFNTFDFANPDITTGERVLTTVPQQALFMMNSPFVGDQVRQFMERKDYPKNGSDDDKVTFLFKVAFQRPPSSLELNLAREFLSGEPVAGFDGGAFGRSDSTAPLAGNDVGRGRKPAALPSNASGRPLTAFERFAQVVLLTNEFMYLR